MAVQSLYRRYRPRKFSEIRGQDHVVRSLRNAVLHDREGQGYLFSGPRGTGKTTSARILAKVLNCVNPVDGEPCCECDSCLAVQAGTSFDVHELDAASNNGVEAMRDLIEKAALGTPGRHKVYILDEVHMLSKGAEAALLKTLEEPPPHVVFVLATTDPQKVSATIRSRVQQLEFHLLPMDELEAHIRWVAADAGLTVSEEGFQAVLVQGGGSARDTLSALELVAASGGEPAATMSYDSFVEALIGHDPGQALSALAYSVQQGREARQITQEIIRHLRDCFLSLMAPELVQLPDQQAAVVADQAQRLGAAAIVRAMERLGEILVEMRHAPDPRLLLDIALVQLTHEASGSDTSALLARIDRLEKAVAAGAATVAATPARPAPLDPATGRAALGGRARRDDPGAQAESKVVRAETGPSPAAVEPQPAPTPEPEPTRDAERESTSTSSLAPGVATRSVSGIAADVAQAWQPSILPTLRPMARALLSAGHFLGERDGALAFGLPNETHRSKCEQHRTEIESAISAHLGSPVKLLLVVDLGTASDDNVAPVVQLRASARSASASVTAPPTADEDIDVDDLIDAPPGSVRTTEDRLAEAFPGSVFIEDPR